MSELPLPSLFPVKISQSADTELKFTHSKHTSCAVGCDCKARNGGEPGGRGLVPSGYLSIMLLGKGIELILVENPLSGLGLGFIR